MMSSSTLVQRRRGVEEDTLFEQDEETQKSSKQLTIMEEVLLLGLKDNEGLLSFWNDNISYVLRGAILMELAFADRIKTLKEPRKKPFSDRLIEVVDDSNTGEVLLDEAIKMIKCESNSIGNWVDLLSGETWNLTKVGYQLKQVRERIAKGLVDKGVLRTEKRSFVIFDIPSHPVADKKVKQAIIHRVTDCLLGRGPSPDARTIALVCAAFAANVLENAFVGLTHAQREFAFQKVDQLMKEHASLSDQAKANGVSDIVAGVLTVYSKMDGIL